MPSSAYLVTSQACALTRVFSHGLSFLQVFSDVLDGFGGSEHPGLVYTRDTAPSEGTKTSPDWLEVAVNVLLLIMAVFSWPPVPPPPLPNSSTSLFLMKCECPFGSGTKGVRGGEKSWRRTLGQKSEAVGWGVVGVLETLCFYPTVKLFVLNEAKKTLNGFQSGDRNMFVYVSVWRERQRARERARESMHRKDWGFVQVKTSQEDGFNLPMLCLHVYNVKGIKVPLYL